MPIPRIYVDEPCPLDGYEGLAVRVLANATDREWREWAGATLGDPECAECAALIIPAWGHTPLPRCAACAAAQAANQPTKPNCTDCAALIIAAWLVQEAERVYCQKCAAARAAWGRAFVLFYGPKLLDHDVSTPEAALALFDDDDALPSEIVIWLHLVPGQVRLRRQEQLVGNLTGSLTTPST